MASVSFHEIEKSFGSTKVIHGIGFDIKDGEFMVLVGPSGCGKSTLLRVAMRAEIKALHQRLKTTTVYVTHDQVEAMTMADRIVVMHDGRIEQIGTPLDLYDRPDNLFVAQFIGSPAMNVVNGRLRRGSGSAVVEMSDGVQWPLFQ